MEVSNLFSVGFIFLNETSGDESSSFNYSNGTSFLANSRFGTGSRIDFGNGGVEISLLNTTIDHDLFDDDYNFQDTSVLLRVARMIEMALAKRIEL